MQNSERSWNDSHNFVIIYSKVKLLKWKNNNANVVGMCKCGFSVRLCCFFRCSSSSVRKSFSEFRWCHSFHIFRTERLTCRGQHGNEIVFHELIEYLRKQRAALAIFEARYCDAFFLFIQSVLILDATVWTSTLWIYAKKFNRRNDKKQQPKERRPD